MTMMRELTLNQQAVLDAVQIWKRREGCGASVAELIRHSPLLNCRSPAQVRSALLALKKRNMVFCYGVADSGACWHPDPPGRSGRRTGAED